MTEYAAVMDNGKVIGIPEEDFLKIKSDWMRNIERNIQLSDGSFLRTSTLVLSGPKTAIAQRLGIDLATVDQTEVRKLIEAELAPIKQAYEQTIANQLEQINSLKAAIASLGKTEQKPGMKK